MLLESNEFQKYLEQVKKQYRRDRPTSANNSDDSSEIEKIDSDDEKKAKAFLTKQKRIINEARKKRLTERFEKKSILKREQNRHLCAPLVSAQRRSIGSDPPNVGR